MNIRTICIGSVKVLKKDICAFGDIMVAVSWVLGVKSIFDLYGGDGSIMVATEGERS